MAGRSSSSLLSNPGNFINCAEVLACVKNSTFSFTDSIKDAVVNMKTRDSVMTETLWSSIMDTVYYGMCHTFTFPDKVYADMVTDGFLFCLDPSLSYRVIFHDPRWQSGPALSLVGSIRDTVI